MDEAPLLQIQRVAKTFGSQKVLKGISLDVRKGEFMTFLGPSGCGKTTTLRIVAGLEDPDEGTVRLSGRDVTREPANKRDVHTVFQHYALFPHLDVFENVAFSLRLKRLAESEIAGRVREALALVKLEGFETRAIHKMSGGQQQRIALARSLVGRPSLLLLDEPLGALDLKLRLAMQLELKNIQKKTGITFIYVTHDQEEALTLSDRIAVFNQGEIVQLGTPRHIYENPASSFVADFIGTANVFDGVAAGGKDGRKRIVFEGGLELVFPRGAELPVKVGDKCSVAIRPERFELRFAEPLAEASGVVSFPAFLRDAVYLGASTQLILTPALESSKTITAVTMNPIEVHGSNGSGPRKIWLQARIQDILFLGADHEAQASSEAVHARR